MRAFFGFYSKLNVHKVVFPFSAAIVIICVILSIVYGKESGQYITNANSWILKYFDNFYLIAVNGFVLALFAIIISPRASIKLGGPNSKPEFSFLAWVSMLFSAGMGIGLVFWGVAEPLNHFNSYPFDKSISASQDASIPAISLSLFHWGIHAWAIYAIVGLALGYFAYNKGYPLTLRSTLQPLLKKKVNGTLGNIVDIVATVATLFGVATSLGFGAKQINSGLTSVFHSLEVSASVQIIIISFITICATFSVVSGLNKGIKLLSNTNILIALCLMVLVFALGSPLEILAGTFKSLLHYCSHFVQTSTVKWTGGVEDEGWLGGNTVFYWAWWIAWSPFVGMFIARISKGRTVREFLLVVLFIPLLITLVWFNVFGYSSILYTLNGTTQISETVSQNYAMSLFALFDQIPFTLFLSFISIVVIILFFVTSSDSASYVVDVITSGGNEAPHKYTKIFWAVLEGLIAVILVYIGGQNSLTTLQTASIIVALPLSFILVVLACSLVKDFYTEYKDSET